MEKTCGTGQNVGRGGWNPQAGKHKIGRASCFPAWGGAISQVRFVVARVKLEFSGAFDWPDIINNDAPPRAMSNLLTPPGLLRKRHFDPGSFQGAGAIYEVTSPMPASPGRWVYTKREYGGCNPRRSPMASVLRNPGGLQPPRPTFWPAPRVFSIGNSCPLFCPDPLFRLNPNFCRFGNFSKPLA